MNTPEIAVFISTYQRPLHLRRSLASVAGQRGIEGKMEVVVTDDGSCDETREVVEEFARRAQFPVKFTTHPHDGFRIAQCRNEGVSVAEAPYFLFTDGDCLLPPDHVAIHLGFRRRGIAVAGESYRLDQATSGRITEPVIQSGEFTRWAPLLERWRLANKDRRAKVYQFLGHRTRPHLTGCNTAVWRDDYEQINGFDENYVGWGLEDRDLQLRLSRLGVRFRSIMGLTATYHLWHPLHSTYTHNNVGTPNLRYFLRPDKPIRCRLGLVKEDAPDILPFPTPAYEKAGPRRIWDAA